VVVAALIGFLFGFIGSMPVAGPIAVLIFSRAVENRIRSALFIGLGAVIPETAYAFLAFYGFSSLLSSYPFIVPISRGAAALILLALGASFARRRVHDDVRPVKAEGRWGSFGLGFAICGLNPTLLATWTAVGLRFGLPIPLVPEIFGHVGYGSASWEHAGVSSSESGFTWDLGLASELFSIPLLSLGIHVAYKALSPGDENGVAIDPTTWIGLGVHGEIGF